MYQITEAELPLVLLSCVESIFFFLGESHVSSCDFWNNLSVWDGICLNDRWRRGCLTCSTTLVVNSVNVRTNQAQYSEIGPNIRTNEQPSAPEADWAERQMKTSIAPFLLKNDLLFCKASDHGNLSELSAKHFFGEYSDKGVSAQYLRPNIHPIYQKSPLY